MPCPVSFPFYDLWEIGTSILTEYWLLFNRSCWIRDKNNSAELLFSGNKDVLNLHRNGNGIRLNKLPATYLLSGN